MSRYIDADKALEIWKDQDYIKLSSQENKARIMLDAVPSADVVEVVRCKDCKYHEELLNDKDGNVICWVNDIDVVVDGNGYCSYGERKGQENE